MAAIAISNLKILLFGHVTVIWFNIWCSVPYFIKIRRFFTEIWRYNDFQNGGHLPSWILKICIFCCGLCRHAVLLPQTKFCRNQTIGQWVMAKKVIFKMAVAAILNSKKNSFVWSRDGNWVTCSISDVVYQISSKSDNFSLRYGDLTIYIHTCIAICRARCVDSTEYLSNQRRWRQSLGGQLLASKVVSFISGCA